MVRSRVWNARETSTPVMYIIMILSHINYMFFTLQNNKNIFILKPSIYDRLVKRVINTSQIFLNNTFLTMFLCNGDYKKKIMPIFTQISFKIYMNFIEIESSHIVIFQFHQLINLFLYSLDIVLWMLLIMILIR